MTTLTQAQAAPVRHPLAKVPEVTAVFWITKVLTTGMGETTSDYLVHRFSPVIAVGIGALGLAGALLLQFGARRYQPWIYWLAIVMVSVFGTMAADVLHIGLHIPYQYSTAFYLVALAGIFIAWYAVEKTLSIHSIYTRRREAFYWLVVLATFALGTASGDMTATTLHLGYLASGILFAVVIAVPAIAHWKFNLNPIFAFWFAYVITRPLGASFADWMAVTAKRGGLDLGPGPVSIALTILIAACVAYLSIIHRRSSRLPHHVGGPGGGTQSPGRAR